MFPFERIIIIKEFSPGYDDHASDVWYVKTDSREVIVRASKIKNVKCANVFFKSLNILFATDPSNVFAIEAINNTLSSLNAFTYPKILEKHKIDREYAIVELLEGSFLDSFKVLPKDELRKFRANLAKIHNHKMNYLGNPAGVSMGEVNNHIIRSMKEIVNEFYSNNHKIINYLLKMEHILSDIAAPEYTSFVLTDIDPSHFLAANGIITGLVDTEAYAMSPRELDFIALEYVLDTTSAELISEGYESVLSIPDLKSVRTVYRYLYRLIEIQGDDDIDDWLSQPSLF